jgi:Nuclease-related domain
MDVGSEPKPAVHARQEQSPPPVMSELPSARAWGDGARGEELLGHVLADVPGVIVLHDRRMPQTRTNIDHVVVGPGGVFVVEAKRYAGRIGIRNKGTVLRSDRRLYVGRRDCSGLAEKVAWQAKVLREALQASGIDELPPITPVLCFVDGDWPLINPPSSFGGVRLESERSITRLVGRGPAVDPNAIEWATRVLAAALPAK